MSSIEKTEGEFLWVQKYRPRKVADTILPAKTKEIFQKFVDNGEVPNLILVGGPGTGKTTVAMAMLEELGADYIIFNGSIQTGVDNLRTNISNYASSVSLSGGRKYVIIDEADYLSLNAQSAFRGMVEEFSSNCGFILTCNYKNKIIEPIRKSRFTNIEFSVPKDEKQKMELQFFKRVLSILDIEGIEYDKSVIAKAIDREFPDFRSILGTFQSYASTGKIDIGILANLKKDSIDQLYGFLKEKNFTEMRKWVGENSDMDSAEFYTMMYETATTRIAKESLPGFVVTLGEYMHKQYFALNPSINIAAFLTEIMFEVTFK